MLSTYINAINILMTRTSQKRSIPTSISNREASQRLINFYGPLLIYNIFCIYIPPSKKILPLRRKGVLIVEEGKLLVKRKYNKWTNSGRKKKAIAVTFKFSKIVDAREASKTPEERSTGGKRETRNNYNRTVTFGYFNSKTMMPKSQSSRTF